VAIGLVQGSVSMAPAQIDPYPRSLLQLGYDQSLSGQGPQSLYAYYYYNDPEFLRTNVALRLAVAPVYLDGEISFRQLLPSTDVGIGVNGGGYGENYYEVSQGHYLKGESFDGHGGGVSLNLYHLINPAHLIRNGQNRWSIQASRQPREHLRARGPAFRGHGADALP
jgi:hypothetical protein